MNDDFLVRTLRETRAQRKKSQEYMALELGVARKTVQNWEMGISTPNIEQVRQWFSVLNISPLPFLHQYTSPYLENISGADDDAKLRQALEILLADIPPEGVRQLLYLFYGDHGSSPRAVLNMVTAHLQTPMRDRVTAGSVICKNYEIAQKKGQLTDEKHIQPNMDILRDAIERGEVACVEGNETYVKK